MHDKRKHVDFIASLRGLDVSLWYAVDVQATNIPCTCFLCKGKYNKVTWDKINKSKWSEACIYLVCLQIMRMNTIKRIPTPPDLIEYLRRVASASISSM